MARTSSIGIIYLLHLEQPFGHSKHYTGWTINLENRLSEHRAGRGARLLELCGASGIGFQVARTWTGTRARERALKRQGGARRRCPICGVKPRKTA